MDIYYYVKNVHTHNKVYVYFVRKRKITNKNKKYNQIIIMNYLKIILKVTKNSLLKKRNLIMNNHKNKLMDKKKVNKLKILLINFLYFCNNPLLITHL